MLSILPLPQNELVSLEKQTKELQGELLRHKVNGKFGPGTPYTVTGCYLQKYIFNEENDGNVENLVSFVEYKYAQVPILISSHKNHNELFQTLNFVQRIRLVSNIAEVFCFFLVHSVSLSLCFRLSLSVNG